MELKLYDDLHFRNDLICTSAAGYSDDGRAFVLSSTGLYILTLQGVTLNTLQKFSFRQDFVEVCHFSPRNNVQLNPSNINFNNLQEYHQCEMNRYLRLNYYSNSIHNCDFPTIPISASWSPKGIVRNRDCMLAVITSLYNLSVYVKFIYTNGLVEYVNVCNLTSQIVSNNKIKSELGDSKMNNVTIGEFTKRVERLSISACVWSHVFTREDKRHVILFAGHLNGDITSWRIENYCSESKEQLLNPTFLGCYKTDLQQITCLQWHETDTFAGALLVADIKGTLIILNVKDLVSDQINFTDKAHLLSECDLKVDAVKVFLHKNNTFILIAQKNYIHIIAVDSSGTIFDQKDHMLKFNFLSGISHFKNVVYLLTENLIKRLIIDCHERKITVEEQDITLKIDFSKYFPRGLIVSTNQVIFGVILTPARIAYAEKNKHNIHLFLFRDMSTDPLKLLMDNVNNSLENMIDYLDVLRLTSLKERRFPWIGIPDKIDYDSATLQALKIYRLISKLSDLVMPIVPRIEYYGIKPYVLLHYAVRIKLATRRMKRLLSSMRSGVELSDFQMRSIDLLNFFLKEMVSKDILLKAKLGENFIDEIYEVMQVANELEYPDMPPCVWCGEKIIGESCIPPHTDSRCVISLMPVSLMPRYVCSHCKSVAHEEISKEVPVIVCPYCDIAMDYCIVYSETDNLGEILAMPENVKSDCQNDCLQESIEVEDMEPPPAEYVFLSDEEEIAVSDEEETAEGIECAPLETGEVSGVVEEEECAPLEVTENIKIELVT